MMITLPTCKFMLLLLIVLPLLCGAAGKKPCSVVINELNSDDPGMHEFDEFIELKAVQCVKNKQPSLRPYMLIIVEEYNKRVKGPAVVFSADLYHQSFKGSERFFVIGSPSHLVIMLYHTQGSLQHHGNLCS